MRGLTYKFNKEKINEMLKEFYTISKVTMSVWDSDFNQITFYPNPMAPICAKIKSNEEGKKKCLESDICALKKAATTKNAYTFSCHAGLVDTVVPIYHNDELMAYIMFGQIKDKEQSLSNIDKVKKECKKYNVDEKTIDKHYKSLPTLNRQKIDAISALFKMCIPYFYTSSAIKPQENKLADEIEMYIMKNLTSKLSIEELCNKFQITITALYEISHKFFKTSIKDYIIEKRIDKAKYYLTTTQMPVSEVCDKVGFNDYNFFIRTFKKRTGYTPLSYKKNFPLNIL